MFCVLLCIYFEYLGGNSDLKNESKFSLSTTMKNVRNKTKTKFIKKFHTAHATDAHAQTAPHTATNDHLARLCNSLAIHEKLFTTSSIMLSMFIDCMV